MQTFQAADGGHHKVKRQHSERLLPSGPHLPQAPRHPPQGEQEGQGQAAGGAGECQQVSGQSYGNRCSGSMPSKVLSRIKD